jgi:hypothetical protein
VKTADEVASPKRVIERKALEPPADRGCVSYMPRTGMDDERRVRTSLSLSGPCSRSSRGGSMLARERIGKYNRSRTRLDRHTHFCHTIMPPSFHLTRTKRHATFRSVMGHSHGHDDRMPSTQCRTCSKSGLPQPRPIKTNVGLDIDSVDGPLSPCPVCVLHTGGRKKRTFLGFWGDWNKKRHHNIKYLIQT